MFSDENKTSVLHPLIRIYEDEPRWRPTRLAAIDPHGQSS